MSMGISAMYDNSNRQARQGMRGKIFSENHPASIRQTFIFALLMTALTFGDLLTSPEQIKKSLLFRGAILAILLASAFIKRYSKSLIFNYATAYLSLALCEVALIVLLHGLNGLGAGVGQFIFFFFGTLLFCTIFPFNYNMVGCIFLTIIPIGVGILLGKQNIIIYYLCVLAPGCILTILLHWRLRYHLVETQNNRQEVESIILVEPITGMLNYRGFERCYQRNVKLGLVQPALEFLLLIEIAGWEAIKASLDEKQVKQLQEKLGDLIESSLDCRNITACLGNIEFVSILHRVSQEEAYAMAENLRKTLAGTEFDCPALESGKASFKASIGIVPADTKEEMRSLISRARLGLNQAVALGGNQCILISRTQ